MIKESMSTYLHLQDLELDQQDIQRWRHIGENLSTLHNSKTIFVSPYVRSAMSVDLFSDGSAIFLPFTFVF